MRSPGFGRDFIIYFHIFGRFILLDRLIWDTFIFYNDRYNVKDAFGIQMYPVDLL